MDITPNVQDVNITVSSPALTGITIAATSAVAISGIGGAKGDTGPAGTTDHLLLTNIGTNTHAQLDTAVTNSVAHISNTSNPHAVTKAQVGLSNVDNTSDVNKPVSNAQAAADATKAAISGQVFTGAISATNLSGTNTGDNATNTQYSGIVTNATHTGDAAGATVLTLATVNANIGSFGTATSVPAYTVNAKGLITASANTAIQIPESQVTSLVTDLAGKQPTLTLTTIGTSGASTLVGATLNIPSYAGGGSGITRNISTITTAVTVGSTASVDYEVNVGAGGTPTLPTAVGNTNEYSIKNIDTANHVINTTLSQTIDGSASGITIVPNQSLTLLSDTANWRII